MILKKSLKIQEGVNRRRTSNTMVPRKRTDNTMTKSKRGNTIAKRNETKRKKEKQGSTKHSHKCLYQVRVITVFTVFRLLTDFVCLYNYEF
jgi:hypothetical protein